MDGIFVVIILFIAGILLIVKGGDFFVDAAVWIAEISGVPQFIIGATVVSFATTLPELLVSLIAAFDGKVEMAAGNAIGSVTANVALIMSISILAVPAVIKRSQIAAKSLLLILVCAALALLSLDGSLSILDSILLLVLFAVFMGENVFAAKKSIHAPASQRRRPGKTETLRNIALFIIGIAGIVVGAQLLVDNGSALARLLGVPESVIGVTMIAVGTSLPELVTTITAIVKKQSSLSIGNIIGANIIDLAIILPLCAVFSGKALPAATQTIYWDLPVCLGAILIALLPPLITQKFHRWQGFVMLAGYIGYVALLV